MTSDVSIITRSHEETTLFGKILGEIVPRGTVIALDGDLGSGKTTLVQGFAKGLGVSDEFYITSPTYTLIHEYKGRHRFFHVDLYRLITPMELDDLGFEDIVSGDSIVAIEWPDKLPRNYLAEFLSIKIDIMDKDIRKIRIVSCGRENKDLIVEIGKKMKEKKWH